MNFITRYFTQIKMPLGRWNILDHNKTMLKVKYATEDNCFATYTNYNKMLYQKNELDEKKIIYMMGFESAHD